MNRVMLLAAIYEKTRLSMREVCRELNISYNTGRAWRAQGRFPIKLTGSPLAADISDVAAHLDSLEEDQDDDAGPTSAR